MADLLLRDGTTTTTDRRLDLIRFEHPKQLGTYAVAELLGHTARRGRGWRAGPVLDQGREGACVGFACIGEAVAYPVPYGRTLPPAALDALARTVYHRATELDPWPETTPAADLGTSIDAGGAAMVELGFADEYRWARNVDELIDVLARGSRDGATFGPVIAGVEWRDGMYDTDPDGIVTVDGRTVGGHAILVRGVALRPRMRGRRITEPLFTWRNSWGPSYGVTGDGYITATDLEAILGDRPELMVPVSRRLGGPPT